MPELRFSKPAALVVALTILAGLTAGVQAAPLKHSLTEVLRGALKSSGTPGAAVTITRGGKIVWSGALGFSNKSTGAPFTATTLSSVASVTKLVTGSIILRMVEDGLLKLDDPIAPYVPSYIPATHQVTIRNLISMRSGYTDIENATAFVTASQDPNHRWTRSELFKPITPPHFTPGSQYEYSNVNFLLLSQIIDTVYPGGMPAAFVHYIAKPAHLGDDVVFNRLYSVASRFAHGYETRNSVTTDVDKGALDLGVNTSVWGTIWGDGGIGATAEGLARFADALFAGKIVKPSTLAEMEADVASGYGLAMEDNFVDGHDWFGHLGAFNGYTAFVGHDRVRDVTITVVANALNEDNGAQLKVLVALIDAYDAGAGLQ